MADGMWSQAFTLSNHQNFVRCATHIVKCAFVCSVEEISSVDEPPPLPTRPPPNDLEVAPDSTHTVASVVNDKYNASELYGDDDEDLSANFK